MNQNLNSEANNQLTAIVANRLWRSEISKATVIDLQMTRITSRTDHRATFKTSHREPMQFKLSVTLVMK